MQEPVTNNNPAADGVSTSMSCCWFFFLLQLTRSITAPRMLTFYVITTTRKFNHKNWNKLNVFPLEETRKCTSNWLGGRPSTGPWQNDCSSWWSSTHTAGNGAVFSVCVEEVELGRVGVKEKPWMDMFCQVKTRSKFPTNNIGSYDLLHTTRHPPICSPSRPLLSTSSSFFAMVAIDAR